MEIQRISSALALVFGIGCFVPYIMAIIRKKTKPMKATWLIWASLDTITIAGMSIENSINGQILAAVIGAWIVFFLSLRFGIAGWTRLDMICLVSVGASILFWWLFNSPLLGIVICLLANFIGSIPTVCSVWKNANHENKLAWVLGTIASMCALGSISNWTLSHYAQPVSFLAVQVLMLYLLFIRAVIPISVKEEILQT